MWVPGRLRGATGVYFNNTVHGVFSEYVIKLDNVRTCEDRGAGGFADGTSPWDGNTAPIATHEGWPARDQIGRGKDVSLWTAESPYPAQTSEPAYAWGNTRQENGASVVFANYGGCSREWKHIIEGRDYFNGTAKPGYTPYTYPHPLRGETPAPVVPVMRQGVRLRFG